MKTPEFTLANIDNKVNGITVEIIVPTMSHLPRAATTYHLASVNLSALHNIQKQIEAEPPIGLTGNTSHEVIYHTTIPLYIVITGTIAATSIVIIYLRRFIIKKTENDTSIEKDIELSERRQKQDAIFALDIGK